MDKISAYAPLLEKIFLVGLLIGVVLSLLHVAPFNITVTVVSLYGLGPAYYFSAFQRFQAHADESQKSQEGSNKRCYPVEDSQYKKKRMGALGLCVK